MPDGYATSYLEPELINTEKQNKTLALHFGHSL